MFNPKIFTPALILIAVSLGAGCSENAQQDQIDAQAPSSPAALPDQTTQNPSIGQTGQTTQNPSPGQTGQTNQSNLDQQFMLQAAQDGLAEVQLGQLASERAASDEVRQFGEQMVQNHTQANTQLQELASQKGVTLPTDIGPENEQVSQELSQVSGADFDRAYMNHMVEAHTKDVSLFQNQAQQGQDPDLKAFASQTLPTLEEHLQRARSIAENTNSTDTSTPNTTP